MNSKSKEFLVDQRIFLAGQKISNKTSISYVIPASDEEPYRRTSDRSNKEPLFF